MKRRAVDGKPLLDLGKAAVYYVITHPAREDLLPIGAKLKRDLPKDTALTGADVELPAGRLVDKLRIEQAEMFGLTRSSAA